MENKTTSKLIAGFVALIIGIVLSTSLASLTNEKTNLTTQSETINIANARYGAAGTINESYTFTLSTGVANWRNDYSECIPTTIIYKNQSGATMTDPTNYVYTYNVGTLTLKNTEALNLSGSNTTTTTYAYCPNEYVSSSWARTGLTTTVGLFALGLFLTAVGLFYSVAKDTGIMD